MATKEKLWRWFAEYRCGCVGEFVERKRDALGYCGKHGDSARQVHRVQVPESEAHDGDE